MLVDRLRRVYQEIAKVERVLMQFPEDMYIRANLVSLQRDAEQLEAEWTEEVRSEQKEVCRYRIISPVSDSFSVRAVTQSLIDFQNLFTQIFDALKNGARKNARLSVEAIKQTELNLAFTYPGSLGVAMSINSALDLFDGKFDASIDALMQLVETRDEHDVRDVAKSLGEAVVKRVYDWAKINSGESYSIDLNWTTLSGSQKGGILTNQLFDRLVTLISHTSDSVVRSVAVRGVLVGMDTKTKRFRFIDPVGEDYVGYLSEEFPASQIWHVNRVYIAQIEIEETLEYATESVKKIQRLKHLEIVKDVEV